MENYYYFERTPRICEYFFDKVCTGVDELNRELQCMITVKLECAYEPPKFCRVLELPTSIRLHSTKDVNTAFQELKAMLTSEFMSEVSEQIFCDAGKYSDAEVQIRFLAMDHCPKSNKPGLLFCWDVKR